MKLELLRAPALAATAVLLISGTAIVFAASPTPAAPTPLVAAPVAPVSAAEPAGPDTDTLQVGDQTTPNVVPDAAAAVEPAAADASKVKAAEKSSSETAAEAPDGTEAKGAESDGPGKHQDPAGQNVDHQFDGEE